MQARRSPRFLLKSQAPTSLTHLEHDGYPDNKPNSATTKTIHFLNCQSFLEGHFAKTDAKLVYALFGSKIYPTRRNAIFPETIFPETIPPENALKLYRVWGSMLSANELTLEQCRIATQEVLRLLPGDFTQEDAPLLQQ